MSCNTTNRVESYLSVYTEHVYTIEKIILIQESYILTPSPTQRYPSNPRGGGKERGSLTPCLLAQLLKRSLIRLDPLLTEC